MKKLREFRKWKWKWTKEKVMQFISTNKRAFLVFAAVVVFFTTYALILPAITLDRKKAKDTPGINVDGYGRELPADGMDGSQDPDRAGANAADRENSQSDFMQNLGDLRVQVTADGAFPADTEMKLAKAHLDDDLEKAILFAAMDATDAEEDRVKIVQAMDISFWANDEEVEPETEVRVAFHSEDFGSMQAPVVAHLLAAEPDENGDYAIEVLVPVETEDLSEEEQGAEGIVFYRPVNEEAIHVAQEDLEDFLGEEGKEAGDEKEAEDGKGLKETDGIGETGGEAEGKSDTEEVEKIEGTGEAGEIGEKPEQEGANGAQDGNEGVSISGINSENASVSGTGSAQKGESSGSGTGSSTGTGSGAGARSSHNSDASNADNANSANNTSNASNTANANNDTKNDADNTSATNGTGGNASNTDNTNNANNSSNASNANTNNTSNSNTDNSNNADNVNNTNNASNPGSSTESGDTGSADNADAGSASDTGESGSGNASSASNDSANADGSKNADTSESIKTDSTNTDNTNTSTSTDANTAGNKNPGTAASADSAADASGNASASENASGSADAASGSEAKADSGTTKNEGAEGTTSATGDAVSASGSASATGTGGNTANTANDGGASSGNADAAKTDGGDSKSGTADTAADKTGRSGSANSGSPENSGNADAAGMESASSAANGGTSGKDTEKSSQQGSTSASGTAGHANDGKGSTSQSNSNHNNNSNSDSNSNSNDNSNNSSGGNNSSTADNSNSSTDHNGSSTNNRSSNTSTESGNTANSGSKHSDSNSNNSDSSNNDNKTGTGNNSANANSENSDSGKASGGSSSSVSNGNNSANRDSNSGSSGSNSGSGDSSSSTNNGSSSTNNSNNSSSSSSNSNNSGSDNSNSNSNSANNSNTSNNSSSNNNSENSSSKSDSNSDTKGGSASADSSTSKKSGSSSADNASRGTSGSSNSSEKSATGGSTKSSAKSERTWDAAREIRFHADSFSIYCLVETESIVRTVDRPGRDTYILSEEGDGYFVKLRYTEKAGIPEGAELYVDEIPEGSEEFAEYYSRTQEQGTGRTGTASPSNIERNDPNAPDSARFFDIRIFDAGGEEIEPKAPVEVQIFFDGDFIQEDGREIGVFYYGGQKAMKLESEIKTSSRYEEGSTNDASGVSNTSDASNASDASSEASDVSNASDASAYYGIASASNASTSNANAGEAHSAYLAGIAVEEDALSFVTDKTSVFGILDMHTASEGSLTASDGQSYRVSVFYDGAAGIPEDASLAVRKIPGAEAEAGSAEEYQTQAYRAYQEYQTYLERAAELLPEDESIALARLFDIRILNAYGEELRLSAPVDVEIELLDAEGADALRQDSDKIQVLRFAGENGDFLEVLEDAEKNGNTAAFQTEELSVCAIIKAEKTEDAENAEKAVNAENADSAGAAGAAGTPQALELAERSITDSSGSVRVTGKLPKNATVVARELTAQEVDALDLKNAQIVFAYDITIYVDGEEYQPEEAVNVEILRQNESVTDAADAENAGNAENTQDENGVENAENGSNIDAIDTIIQGAEADTESGSTASSDAIMSAGNGGAAAESKKKDLEKVRVSHIETDDAGAVLERQTVESTVNGDGKVEFTAESFSIYIGFKNYTIKLTNGTGYKYYSDEACTSEMNGEHSFDDDMSNASIFVKAETNYTIQSIEMRNASGDAGDINANATATGEDLGNGTYKLTIPSTITQNQIVTVSIDSHYIYFDLNAGSIVIKDNDYSGYIYSTTGGKTEKKQIGGTHNAENHYYVYQSQSRYVSAADSYYTTTGEIDGVMKIPVYAEVKYDGKSWEEYVTNNKDVDAVNRNWPEAARKVYRDEVTDKNITITGSGNFDLTIDNLWATKFDNDTGTIHITRKYYSNRTIIRLRNTSKLTKVFYNRPYNYSGYLKFTSFEGDGYDSGSMTLTFPDNTTMTAVGLIGAGHALEGNSTRGYASRQVAGVYFEGGTIYVGLRKTSNSQWFSPTNNINAAIGGANSYGEFYINGGIITAISHSTAAAIGGGGHDGQFGSAKIDITGGTIYAYNFGVYSTKYNMVVPGTAIGGGSTMGVSDMNYSECGNADITITGGKIYAESIGGVAIGGGCSANRGGGNADIRISGDAIVEAYSKAGTIAGHDTPAGTSIGGGTAGIQVGYSGGSANLSIEGGDIVATSVGGGSCLNTNGDGGSASVSVTAGNITLEGKIGGGPSSGSGKGGDASIYVSGGLLDCSSIGGGDSVTGTPGAVNSAAREAGVIISNGAVVKSGTIGGGKNDNGAVGFATANITGGDIQGQFILENHDPLKKCFFKMSGGTIDNTGLIDGSKYLRLRKDGGVVYLVDNNGEVDISGGTIRNCTGERGGTVYMTAGNVKISGNAKIQNSTAANGGVVYMADGTMEMSGGTVENCEASKNGGAVYMASGTVNISGSGTIQNCKANNYGGTVCMDNGAVNMDGGTVKNCEASIFGGAVYMNNGKVDMKGGEIQSCKAGKDGGAIYIQSEEGIFDLSNDGKILGCVAGYTSNNSESTSSDESESDEETGEGASAVASGEGGAVYLFGGTVKVSGGQIGAQDGSDSVSRGNRAANGGGIYLKSGTVEVSGDGSIGYNEASANGGGIYLGGGTLTVSGGVLQGNTAAENGGGAYLATGSTMTVSGGSVIGNEAKNYGGGAYLTGGSLNMTGGSLGSSGEGNGNKAVLGGGAYITDGNFTLNGATALVGYNRAVADAEKDNSGNGGGIYLTGGTPDLRQGTLQGNIADANGGGIYINKKEVNLKTDGYVNILENQAANGGGVYIQGTNGHDASFGIDRGSQGIITLDKNTASVKDGNGGNGGAICINNGYFNVYSDNIIVTNNNAENGGGVAVLSGNFNLSGGSIGQEDRANRAKKGGGIYVNGGNAAVTGGSIVYNVASEDGGGVYLSGGDFLLESADASVSHNVATMNGGGVYLTGGTPDLKLGTLSHNQAEANGGGIYIDKQKVKLSPSGKVEISENGAKNGAGIYIGGSETADPIGASDASFGVNPQSTGTVLLEKNRAEKAGGGVCIVYGDFDVDSDKITVQDNSAKHGGGVAVLSGSFKLSEGSIGTEEKGNSASEYGGGVYIGGGTAEMGDGGSVCGNEAPMGGGIYVNSGTFTMLAGALRKNRAQNAGQSQTQAARQSMRLMSSPGSNAGSSTGAGGGLYVANGTVSITSGSIQENTATGNGGGIYIQGGQDGSFTMTGGNVDKNEASGDGGGVYVKNTSVTFGASSGQVQVSYNKAANGGGFYFDQSDATAPMNASIENGWIEQNEATGNGGGIYQKGGNAASSVTGKGTISSNTADNGGGFYIESGELNLSGGVIKWNKATSGAEASTLETAFNSGQNRGVGGGVYVHSGTFTMVANEAAAENGKPSVGMYGNLADFAADDIYASNEGMLLVPNVKDMDLEDYGNKIGTIHGWFEDFPERNDPNYPSPSGADWKGKQTITPYIRYRTADAENKNSNQHKFMIGDDANAIDTSSSTNKYICMTLGFKYDYTQLDLHKEAVSTSTYDTGERTYTFKLTLPAISQKDDLSTHKYQYFIVDKSGVKEGAISIGNGSKQEEVPIALKHGEHALIEGLEVGSKIGIEEVVEDDEFDTSIDVKPLEGDPSHYPDSASGKDSQHTLESWEVQLRSDMTFTNTKQKTYVRLYKKGVDNTDADGAAKALQGAVFTIYEDSDGKKVYEGKQDIPSATGTGDTGLIFEGYLGKGDYYLKETKVPGGYNMPLGMYKLTINDDWSVSLDRTSVSGLSNIGEVRDDKEVSGIGKVAAVDLYNVTGVELPSSGGPGTKAYALGGIALIAASAMMYGFRTRRRRKEVN